MGWEPADDIGLLALRATIAYVYLHAAWMISRNAEKRAQTATRTSVLLRGTTLDGNMTAATFMAWAGVVLMYLGSLGLLFGIGTRIAAAMLILFTAPGIVVHLRERDQSLGLVDEAEIAAGKGALPALRMLRISTYAAHQSSANKNYALIGACLFLLLAGDPTGRLALASLW